MSREKDFPYKFDYAPLPSTLVTTPKAKPSFAFFMPFASLKKA